MTRKTKLLAEPLSAFDLAVLTFVGDGEKTPDEVVREFPHHSRAETEKTVAGLLANAYLWRSYRTAGPGGVELVYTRSTFYTWDGGGDRDGARRPA